MASSYWIKLYHEILHDRKMVQLSDHLYRRVIELFLIAGQEDKDGALPLTDDIAWTLRTDEDSINADLAELAKVGIVDKRGDIWWVTKFAKRQSKSEPAERMRSMRERRYKEQYYAEAPEEAQEQQEQEPPPETTEQDAAPDADTDCYDTVTNRNNNGYAPATNVHADKIRLDKIRLEHRALKRASPGTQNAQSPPGNGPPKRWYNSTLGESGDITR